MYIKYVPGHYYLLMLVDTLIEKDVLIDKIWKINKYDGNLYIAIVNNYDELYSKKN